MKRFVSIMLVLMLMISSASATSLFPAIDTQLTQQKPELALSYGVMANVAPALVGVDLNADMRGNYQLYENVTEDDYYAFGTYLGENGYALIDQKSTETYVQVVVGKGVITMTVAYNPTAQQLVEVYPLGVEYEIYDPLSGYIEVTANSPFNLNNIAKITVKSASYYNMTTGVFPVLIVDVQNLTQSSLFVRNLNVQLHVFSGSNHYTFDLRDSGRIDFIVGKLSLFGGVLNSMENSEIGYAFDVKQSAIQSINPDRIAVTFSSGYSQYVYNIQ